MEKTKEYNPFVYSTYVGLQTANENRDEYLLETLLAAHRNTEELLDSLHSLHNNIREFYQKIQEQTDINQLMKEHFENYHHHVVEKFYHRMKTTDCVPRFKTKILYILNKWIIDFHLIDQISNQMVQRGIIQNIDGARTRWIAAS
jgi:hypothetical protein